MRKLAFVVLLLAPSAFAKTFQDDKLDVHHDCGNDGEVVIQGNDGNFVVEGACTKVSVNGNHNHVKAQSAKSVTVAGNDNTVSVDAADSISTPGNKNNVSWGKGLGRDKPSVSNHGTDNKVAHH